MTSGLLSGALNPSEKGSTQKGKNLLPRKPIFFLLEKSPLDHFSEGSENSFERIVSLENVSNPLRGLHIPGRMPVILF